MSEVTGAEVLADRERLLWALPHGEGLHGIITTDRADHVLYVLSRYEDPEWWLPKSKSTGNQPDSDRKMDFTRIKGTQLQEEAKIVLARLIWGEVALSNSSVRNVFSALTSWMNWLHDQGISSHLKVTPLVAARYVQYVHRLASARKPGKPLGSMAKWNRLSAVERCWQFLRDTPSAFDYPWPDSSAVALAGHKTSTKAKTDIIPNNILRHLFQHAESLLNRADELLEHREALADFEPCSEKRTTQAGEMSRYLKSRGWDSGFGALNTTLSDLRDGCFVIILAATGIRAHELGNIRRDQWYSQVRDGERFYFLGSRSDKTYEGKTSWLCPEIAIRAVKALERLSEPLQTELEQALRAAERRET